MATNDAKNNSYFDIVVDLVPTKKVIFRKVVSFLTILEEVGGLAESLFSIIGIFFAAYAATNYKLEFVQQAFKQRMNDSPYDPAVY